MRNKLGRAGREVGSTVVMLAVALAVGAVLVVLSGNSPAEAYAAMLKGAFGSPQKLCEVLVKLVPILLMGFGISIAFRAQLWNIGSGGQFVMGSIAATAVALYVDVPVALRVPLSFAAAVAAGALWAGLAGWMKVRFNANEVITTLMLTYVANCFLLYLVNGPMQDPSSDLSQSAMVPEAMKLARLIGTYRLHSGIFLLALVCILMCFFWRTSLGYSIDLVGQGRKVATYAGIPVDRTILVTMLLSGGLAGLAGWIETFGIQYRILDGIAANYGDIANIIALLGALNPFGIMASALFFAALMVGGASMQRMTEVPYSVVDVIQGLIIIFVVAKALFRFRRSGRAAHREGAAHAQ